MHWDPDQLAADASGTLRRRGNRPIDGAFIDSRTPRKDGLFVPIVAVRDGHDFIEAAIDAGASAVLIATGRPVPAGDATVVEVADTLEALTRLGRVRRERFRGPVVAITGSNGKTTTRAMVAAVLATKFARVLCTRGNFNNHLGVPLTLLAEPHDADAMVLELGMNAPGENAALADLVRPTIHVVTSVALEHLEFMGTIEAIAAAEAEPLRFVPLHGTVVLPSDEPLLAPHVPQGPTALRVGPDRGADVEIVSADPGPPMRATLRVGGGDLAVSLRLFGTHNARNAASAIAVGLTLGADPQAMVEALAKVEPVGDRGRTIALGDHMVIADCYNSNPGSVEVALRSLAALRGSRPGPLLAVLGDMLELGPREVELHRRVGELASELRLDGLVAFGERSRATADAASIDAVALVDVEAAARWIRGRLEGAPPGAVLVKASRGMKLERVVERLTEDA